MFPGNKSARSNANVARMPICFDYILASRLVLEAAYSSYFLLRVKCISVGGTSRRVIGH